MTVIGEAFIQIRAAGTPASFEAELNKTVVPGAQRVAKTLATSIGSAFVLSKIKNFAQAGIAELKEAAAVQAQTAAVIKSTGGAANVTADQIGELAESQMRLTGVDDELIQSGANKLATFTAVRNEVGKGNDIFDQATKASLDLSQAGFGSVESAAVLMGKALNDPVQGLTALQRVGVRLSDTQKDLVKELVATGDTLGAQKVILEEVNKQVGGSAEAYGKTLPGQLAIAQESMTNTKAVMVSSLAPALQLTAGAATFLTDQFAKQPAILQQVEGGLLLTVGALGSIITPLKSGIDLWRSFGKSAQAATTAAAGAEAASAAGGISKMGLALRGVAAVGIVGIVGGLAALAHGMSETNVNAERLAAGLENLDAAGQEQMRRYILVASSVGDLDKVVGQLAETSVVGADRFIAAAEAAGIEGDELAGLKAQVEDKRTSDVQGAVDQRAYAGEMDAAVGAAEGLAGATGELAKKQIASESASQRVRTALDAQREAMDKLLGTTNSSITSGLDYRDAVDASADAQATLHQLVVDGKGSTDEYRRAVDDAARTLFGQSEAAGDAAVAQADLSGKTLDAAAKATIQKDELIKLANTLAPGSPLRKELLGFVWTLGEVQPKHVAITAETKAARLEIQKVIDKLHAFDVSARYSQQNPLIFGGGSIASRDHAIGGAQGGLVPSYRAAGGFPGSPRGTDVVPAWLSQGEFVMQRSAVDRLGVATLAAMNRGTATAGAGGQGFTVGQLVVQGATTEGAYATATETVRQLRAEHYRLTGVT